MKCFGLAACLFGGAVALGLTASAVDAPDEKYPLDPQLRVLAADVESPKYRKLVLEEMLVTDLAAEWQRVETADNAETFLERHGGRDKVLADPDLKSAYERRVQIRERFLDLMREGFKRYKQPAPFDRGAKAERAGTTTRSIAAGQLAVVPVMPAEGSERNWPRFRGPDGQGSTSAAKLPLHWDEQGRNVVWRTRPPMSGNSSPIIWDDRIFLTGADPDGTRRFLYCFNLNDGALRWSREAPRRTPEPGVRDKNGFASATPVTDGERVVAFLGSCGLVCYDLAGELLWHYDQIRFDTTHGTGSSPVLYRNLVIFAHDQNRADSVFLALDKRSGEVVWRTERKRAMTWSTPTVLRVGDRDELVFAGGETVKGYDPMTGRELWSLSGPTTEVVPTIVAGHGLLFTASGRNGPTIALRPGGSGDVSDSHLVWRAVRGGPHVPSPILVGDRLYTVNDTGIATCFEAETGRLVWQERIRDRFSTSPIEAGGLVYFASESGVTYVLRAGDKFEIVAQNSLGAPILASPAVAGDRIILRTQDELLCIGAL